MLGLDKSQYHRSPCK